MVIGIALHVDKIKSHLDEIGVKHNFIEKVPAAKVQQEFLAHSLD